MTVDTPDGFTATGQAYDDVKTAKRSGMHFPNLEKQGLIISI